MTDTRVHRFGPARSGLRGGRPSGRRAAAPVASLAVAVLALGGLAGCGDDTGDATATDGDSSSASASPSASTSPSASASPSESASAPATSEAPAVPAIDPLIVEAVQGALGDRFPALIPTVLPQGWTVVGATYANKAWSIALTDATGTPVLLTQRRVELDALLADVVGNDAQETGKVDLKESGLGRWGVYEAGGAVGIARELADTAVVITAVDADTAVQLGQTLLTAEDSDMPEAG